MQDGSAQSGVLDFSNIQTFPAKDRLNLVTIDNMADPATQPPPDWDADGLDELVQRILLARQGGRHCVLSVADPGAPLTPQECRDIFKRFYRVDHVRAMNHSYGMGLAIAARIAEAHRGRIWAESSGGINTFYFTMPI